MSAASQPLFGPFSIKSTPTANTATRAKNLATKMGNGCGIHFANQAEAEATIFIQERRSRATLTAGCQVPSVRRWMAAANAISGRLFTAAAVAWDEEEGIDYRVANSEPARAAEAAESAEQ